MGISLSIWTVKNLPLVKGKVGPANYLLVPNPTQPMTRHCFHPPSELDNHSHQNNIVLWAAVTGLMMTKSSIIPKARVGL